MALPLEGIRVVDLSRYIAGPLCAQLLGDLGAEVIKVESRSGEGGRDSFPMHGGASLYFAAFNRNKRAVTLSLRTEEGKSLLRELIARSDVIVENFRPGVMDKMGFGWAELARLNPRVVSVSISGFGRSGANAHWPAFDAIGQAMSGLMELTGPTDGGPTLVGTFIVDHLSGLNAAIGALAALQQRERTGRGNEVEATLLDSALAALMFYIPWQATSAKPITRNGNRNRVYAASNTFPTKDGAIHIDATRDNMWARLAAVIGRPELSAAPGYATAAERSQRIDEIDGLVAAWSRMRSTCEASERMAGAGVPCGPIRSLEEIVADPSLRERRMLHDVEMADGRVLPVIGNPIRIGGVSFEPRIAPPTLGQDNLYVYCELLGHSKAEIASWTQKQVI